VSPLPREIHYRTAAADLQDLVEKGYLTKRRRNRRILFEPVEDMVLRLDLR
jgi:predicted transcriptional regulator